MISMVRVMMRMVAIVIGMMLLVRMLVVVGNCAHWNVLVSMISLSIVTVHALYLSLLALNFHFRLRRRFC